MKAGGGRRRWFERFDPSGAMQRASRAQASSRASAARGRAHVASSPTSPAQQCTPPPLEPSPPAAPAAPSTPSTPSAPSAARVAGCVSVCGRPPARRAFRRRAREGAAMAPKVGRPARGTPQSRGGCCRESPQPAPPVGARAPAAAPAAARAAAASPTRASAGAGSVPRAQRVGRDAPEASGGAGRSGAQAWRSSAQASRKRKAPSRAAASPHTRIFHAYTCTRPEAPPKVVRIPPPQVNSGRLSGRSTRSAGTSGAERAVVRAQNGVMFGRGAAP